MPTSSHSIDLFTCSITSQHRQPYFEGLYQARTVGLHKYTVPRHERMCGRPSDRKISLSLFPPPTRPNSWARRLSVVVGLPGNLGNWCRRFATRAKLEPPLEHTYGQIWRNISPASGTFFVVCVRGMVKHPKTTNERKTSIFFSRNCVVCWNFHQSY